MRIGVVGARVGRKKVDVFRVLDRFVKAEDIIISGGASGVDTFAEEYALGRVPFIKFAPDTEHSKTPYEDRNRKIAEECEVLLAFPTDSGGTWQTIRFAEQLNKRVVIF